MPNFTVQHADGTDTFNGDDDDTDGIGPRHLSPESADIACMACGTPCVDLTHHRDAWRDSGHRTLAYGETRSTWQPLTCSLMQASAVTGPTRSTPDRAPPSRDLAPRGSPNRDQPSVRSRIRGGSRGASPNAAVAPPPRTPAARGGSSVFGMTPREQTRIDGFLLPHYVCGSDAVTGYRGPQRTNARRILQY